LTDFHHRGKTYGTMRQIILTIRSVEHSAKNFGGRRFDTTFTCFPHFGLLGPPVKNTTLSQIWAAPTSAVQVISSVFFACACTKLASYR
jgi:hypothetical protein